MTGLDQRTKVFFSLAKRAHYSASITEAKATRPIDQPKSILIKE